MCDLLEWMMGKRIWRKVKLQCRKISCIYVMLAFSFLYVWFDTWYDNGFLRDDDVVYAEQTLNSIFRQWNIFAPGTRNTSNVRFQGWNISGNLCTGTAKDNSNIEDSTYSPLIKCDCSYNNKSTCHITHLYLSLLFSSIQAFHFLISCFVC